MYQNRLQAHKYRSQVAIKFYSKIMTVSSTGGQSDINTAERDRCKKKKAKQKQITKNQKWHNHVKESVYCISMSQLL